MGRHRLGKALIHPATLLQGSFDGTGTGLKTLSGQIIDQRAGAPTRFEITILAWMLGQHLWQDRQRLVFLTIGAPRRRGVFESFNTLTQVGFKPATDRMFVAPHGLGNDRNALTAIREQDRQTAFGQVGAPDAASLFQHLALLGKQMNTDHEVSFQKGAVGLVFHGKVLSLPAISLLYNSF